jgi:hypothetical protein
MIDQTTQTVTLDRAAAPLAAPTVVRLDDRDAVVLTMAGTAEVEVWTGTGLRRYPATTAAAELVDPVRQETALRAALCWLHQEQRTAVAEQQAQGRRHAGKLNRIRDYAIEAHRDGDICQDGLNAFLRHFNLAEYEPSVRLTYVLSGRFTVAGRDAETVRAHVLATLKPDFDEVDDVDDDSAQQEITISSVEPAAVSDDHTGYVIRFRIDGGYDVDHSDAGDAETDGRRYLRPSFDDVEGLVRGSVTFAVDTIDGERMD